MEPKPTPLQLFVLSQDMLSQVDEQSRLLTHHVHANCSNCRGTVAAPKLEKDDQSAKKDRPRAEKQQESLERRKRCTKLCHKEAGEATSHALPPQVV